MGKPRPAAFVDPSRRWAWVDGVAYEVLEPGDGPDRAWVHTTAGACIGRVWRSGHVSASYLMTQKQRRKAHRLLGAVQRAWWAARPVVFLDIDGVLNHAATYAACALRPGQTVPADWIDRACVARVDALYARTGAEIVIISSWAAYLSEIQLEMVLRECGLVAPIVGSAPSTCPRDVQPDSTTVRWDAVRAWLGAHPDVTRWAILDDCDWQGFPPSRFVRTRMATGLTDADVARAATILASEARS